MWIQVESMNIITVRDDIPYDGNDTYVRGIRHRYDWHARFLCDAAGLFILERTFRSDQITRTRLEVTHADNYEALYHYVDYVAPVDNILKNRLSILLHGVLSGAARDDIEQCLQQIHITVDGRVDPNGYNRPIRIYEGEKFVDFIDARLEEERYQNLYRAGHHHQMTPARTIATEHPYRGLVIGRFSSREPNQSNMPKQKEEPYFGDLD